MKQNVHEIVVCFSILVLSAISSLTYGTDSLYFEIADSVDIIVAADGSGDYTTVQSAIDAVPASNFKEKIIYIRNGTYKEKILVPSNKPNITLIGQNVDSTILTYDDYSGRIVDGVEIGTSTSFSFAADANDFIAMNLTFENSAGDVGQAVALRTNGDRQSFIHCKMLGYQDTYYTWGRKRNYIKDCKIVGAIDYIFGATTAIFDSCQIHSLRASSYITAAATEEWAKYGYVFFNCRLTADYGRSGIYLGRPWRPYAQTVFFECEEGEFIQKGGWSTWSGNENHTTCFYAEYNCFGPGSDTTNRVDWSYQLRDTDISSYTIENIFSAVSNTINFSGDWVPEFNDNYLFKAVMKYNVKFMDSANFNTSLLEINYNGNVLEDYEPGVYEYYIEFPKGTTEVPLIEAFTEDPQTTYTVKYPNDLPGMSTIIVTAPDGGTIVAYKIFLSVDSAYKNASLEELAYNHIPLPDFQPDVFSYTVELPFGTTRIPSIQATSQVKEAEVKFTRPEQLPGEGVVVLTSVDGKVQNTYTISFTIAPSVVNNNELHKDFIIANPFGTTLDVFFGHLPAGDIEFSFYNLQGELILDERNTATTNVCMDTSSLLKGIYIYCLKVDGKLFTGKVVKIN